MVEIKRNNFLKIINEKSITMRVLSDRTGINICRISDFRLNRAIPNKNELLRLSSVVGEQLKRKDFKYDKKLVEYEKNSMKNFNNASEESTNKLSGFIKCNICGKKFFYRKSKINGHIMAHCETINCYSVIS